MKIEMLSRNLVIIFITLFSIYSAGCSDSKKSYLNLFSLLNNLPENPIYFNTFNSIDSLTSPEISDISTTITNGDLAEESSITGKIDNAFERYFTNTNYIADGSLQTFQGSRDFYPLGNNPGDYTNGTVSVWINLDSSLSYTNTSPWFIFQSPYGMAESHFIAFSDDQSKLSFDVYSINGASIKGDLYINGVLQGSYDFGGKNEWYHLYFVWNAQSMNVFVNNQMAINYDGDMPDLSDMICFFRLFEKTEALAGIYGIIWLGSPCTSAIVTQSISVGRIDNFKIWKSDRANDLSNEYNDGSGIEGY